MLVQEKRKMGSDIKLFIVVSILIAFGFLLLFLNMSKPKDVVTIDGVKVNTQEFQYYYSQNLSQALQYKDPQMDEATFLSSPNGNGTVRDTIKEQTLSQVVQTQVLLLKAKKDKFKANGKEIDEALKSFEANLSQNAASNGMTLQQFTKAAIGVSLNKAKGYYRDYIKSQQYMEAKTEEVNVDEKELNTFYNDNKAYLDRAVVRHILILCEEGAKDEVVAEKKKLAEDILEKVNTGGDIAALAKEYSEDPGSKDNGGMYEIQPNGQMVAEFENWAFSHKSGDTGIVRTSYGFHVMKLDSIFNTLESQMKETELAYKSQKYQSMLQESMSSDQYKIEVQEGYSTF